LVLDRSAAVAAVGRLAAELDLALQTCAGGILRVTEAQITKALRVVSVEHGKDPRGFALLPFGGAGPLLQGPLSRALGCTTVLVPRSPSVLSALGLLTAPVAVHFARTRIARRDGADAMALDLLWRELGEEAERQLA